MIDTDLCPCPLTNMKVQKAEHIVVIKDHEEANIGRPEQERSLLRLKTAIGMELVQLEIIFEAMSDNFDKIHFNQRHWACLSFDASKAL
ncbi:hypothetical protein niasHT_025989 [Heterodera trifolii]|uniref:Uncharacterized protein n=1 Tax=Heterodera trifolii TaxID=157864 RepID=A0ABD2JAE4_9BILA